MDKNENEFYTRDVIQGFEKAVSKTHGWRGLPKPQREQICDQVVVSLRKLPRELRKLIAQEILRPKDAGEKPFKFARLRRDVEEIKPVILNAEKRACFLLAGEGIHPDHEYFDFLVDRVTAVLAFEDLLDQAGKPLYWEICLQLGISHATITRSLIKIQTEGVNGLIPRFGRPRKSGKQ